MHKFLIKDGQGFERDFGGGSTNAAAFARKVIGSTAVVSKIGKDTFWFNPEHKDYFSNLVGSELTILNTAQKILSAKKEAKKADETKNTETLMERAGESAYRVSHAKFGLGTVIKEDALVLVVVFDGQSKPRRIQPDFVERV